MSETNEQKVLSKSAFEHLVAAVGKMLEEGKKTGQQLADSSLAKVYWNIGDKFMEAGLIGRDHYGESLLEEGLQLGFPKKVRELTEMGYFR